MAKSRKRSKVKKQKMKFAPLKGSFMISAILGFLISAYWVYPQDITYGLTFMIVFALMFIASVVSMTKAPLMEEGY